MRQFLAIFALVALLACTGTSAFTPQQNAFVSKVKSSTALEMTVLRYGSKKKDFKAGSPLKSACAALGVKPKYNCKKGDCNSCVLTVGGSRVKPCVGKVPPEPRLKSLIENGLEIR